MRASKEFAGRFLSQYSQFGRNCKAIWIAPLSIDASSLTIVGLAGMPIVRQKPPNPLLIEIVAFQDAQLLDVAGPLQVFASANDWAQASGKPIPYVVRVVAQSTPVITTSGLGLMAASLSRHGSPLDTLLVAGGRGVHAAAANKRLVRWLAQRAPQARRVASVCTGAFLLGAAGLLDGRRSVTHWRDCEELARRFPATRVEIDPIFIRDDWLWTSAGVTAGIDLSLAMIEEDIGHTASIAIARDLVVFLKRSGGQAQFSQVLTMQQSDDSFDGLHEWIAGHLHHDLSVAALAARATMSERSFVRHYRTKTGITPARAVEKMRVEAAQQMLVSSREPIKRIAQCCGFGSEDTMRRCFSRQLGAGPQEYRARFGAKPSRRHNKNYSRYE
jgi:transcriptional regulator GlxA family with amidase domain